MTPNSTMVLRMGTRGSMLAKIQSGMVAAEMEKRHPGLEVQTVIYKTSGDQIADRPLHDAGGKGLFVKELERALLNGDIDFAVHSFKDVPVTMPLVDQDELLVAAVPPREDPRDVIVSDKCQHINDLSQGATVGTGSLRRRCQLLSLRPDLNVLGIRGNIDTRLRRQREGVVEAVVLAMAGLRRAGLFDSAVMTALPTDQLLPAAGQGALSIQCRRRDEKTIGLLKLLHDERTALMVSLEREVVRRLEGDCSSPIAALATLMHNRVRLEVAVGRKGGELPVLRAGTEAEPEAAAAAVDQVLRELDRQHVGVHLHG